MNLIRLLLLTAPLFATAATAAAQDTFAITGTPVGSQLLNLNFGQLPKTISAYDLNICNLTEARHSLTSSQVYQALAESQASLHPIGRQIMLAAILRNQNRSLKTWLNLGLGSTTSVLSVLRTSRPSLAPGTFSAIALGALVAQQVLATWDPVLTADQVEKFETQTLEPALVMDGGSCLERVVFTQDSSKSKPAPQSNLQFHIR